MSASELTVEGTGAVFTTSPMFDEQRHVVMRRAIGGQGALSCYRLLLVCEALLSSLLSPCFFFATGIKAFLDVT